MPRNYEPGDVVEVRAQPRGGGPEQVRGTLTIEDLRDVLTRISSRTGPSGPMAPVTQYILQQAAARLAANLGQELHARDGGEPVPKVLSALVGHEPFVEGQLNLSVHHMRRRWPLAGDWYADLISYILRDSRVEFVDVPTEELQRWLTLPLGELVVAILGAQTTRWVEDGRTALQQTIQALWPTYAPVQEAMRRHEMLMVDNWGTFFDFLTEHYRVQVRPGVSMAEIFWLFDAIMSHDVQTGMVLPESALFADADTGLLPVRPYAARVGMLALTGLILDLDGRQLSLEELCNRLPHPESVYVAG